MIPPKDNPAAYGAIRSSTRYCCYCACCGVHFPGANTIYIPIKGTGNFPAAQLQHVSVG